MCPSLQPLKSHPGGQYRRPGRLLPSEVRPEGPFISRFRNILTHINFLFFFFFFTHQFSKPTENRKNHPGEETEKKSLCPSPTPPRTHPSAVSQSQPDLVSQASTMGHGQLGSFMPDSYKPPLEYPKPVCLLQSPLSLSPSQAILSGSYTSILPNSVKLHFLNIECVIIQPQEHKLQHSDWLHK